MTCSFHVRDFEVLPTERLYRPHRSQAFLNNGDDLALSCAHSSCHFFHCLFEVKEKHDQEGHQSHGDQGEVPIKPKHQRDHKDDSYQVDNDFER